ncbi:MAG: hypothetical protein HOP34_17375 [Methylococcaceae bacterium]|nr:hypothetical protein [Methylococcaceae bacterium]
MTKLRLEWWIHQAELEGRHSQARAWERGIRPYSGLRCCVFISFPNSSLGMPMTKLRLEWWIHQAELEGRHSQARAWE